MKKKQKIVIWGILAAIVGGLVVVKYATDKVDITGFFVMPEVMQGIIPDARKEEIFANTFRRYGFIEIDRNDENGTFMIKK